jgi:hypothetical protein
MSAIIMSVAGSDEEITVKLIPDFYETGDDM